MNKFDVSKLAIIFIKCYFWKKKCPFSYKCTYWKNKFTQFFNDVLLIWNLTISHTSQNGWQTATTVVYTFSRWTVCDILDWSSQRSRKFHHTYWWSFFDVLYCTVAVDEFTPKSILFNWCPLKLGFTWVWKKTKMLEACMFEFKRWITKTWIETFYPLFWHFVKGCIQKSTQIRSKIAT